MRFDYKKNYVGRIVDISDSIISVSGLPEAGSGELIYFKSRKSDIMGLV